MRLPRRTDVTLARTRSRFTLVTLIILITALGAPARAQDSTQARPLAASSAPPWNPPQPIPSARPWETAVRAPGVVASVPFSLLGLGMKGALIFAEEHDVVPKVAAHVSVLQSRGIILRPASLGDRTGWGGEVGLNPTFFRSFVASLSGSTKGYNRTHIALESPQGLLAYENEWRSRDLFFGLGPDSREADGANFATQGQRARLELHYPFRRVVTRPREMLDDPASSTETHAPLRKSIRAWVGSRDMITLDGRENTSKHRPLTERFPAVASELLGTRVEHLIYGAEAEIDHRSGRPHWWKGWRLAGSAERFDEPLKVFAFHSASTPSVQFTRFTYQGEIGASFWRDPRTLRLYVRVQDQVGTDDAGVFLLSDLATLGGGQGLSGFESGRFRDADLMLGRITYIYPLARYLEMDLHTEAGSVVRKLADARASDFETSYGVAVRVRNPFAPLAQVGVDWSRETVRFRFSLGGVE